MPSVVGKRLKLRASYFNDAAFLLKLSEAVERDERLTDDEKQRAISSLKSTAQTLMHLGSKDEQTTKRRG